MFRKAARRGALGVQQQWARMLASNPPSSSDASASINKMIRRSLKKHFLEITTVNPPPKISPPSPFTVMKGSLEHDGPVLKRVYNEEKISISVMQFANLLREAANDGSDDTISHLFIHVDISKAGEESSLNFLCGLSADALEIHSVSLRQKGESTGFLDVPKMYRGPVFQDLDEKLKVALHGYIEERGVDESLFEF